MHSEYCCFSAFGVRVAQQLRTRTEYCRHNRPAVTKAEEDFRRERLPSLLDRIEVATKVLPMRFEFEYVVVRKVPTTHVCTRNAPPSKRVVARHQCNSMSTDGSEAGRGVSRECTYLIY